MGPWVQKRNLSELIEQRINSRWVLVGVTILFASVGAVGVQDWQEPQGQGNKKV